MQDTLTFIICSLISVFHDKLLSTYECNGILAGRWKIDISPIHEAVVLQDVVTGEVSVIHI